MTISSADSYDDVWDIVDFSLREALALRSFLEYLRTWPDPVNKKLYRIQHWREELAAALSRPDFVEWCSQNIQKVRHSPPEVRKTILQTILGEAYSKYLHPNH